MPPGQAKARAARTVAACRLPPFSFLHVSIEQVPRP